MSRRTAPTVQRGLPPIVLSRTRLICVMCVSLTMFTTKTATKRQYSTTRKQRRHRQSRKLSSRRFRIGFGKTPNAETALSVLTTIPLTLSAPVSMTADISLSEVSAQKSRSDLTKSMRLPISFTAATRSLHTRSVQAKPLKWSQPHRRASGSDSARNLCLLYQITLSVSGLPSICDCIRVPIF